MLDWLKNTFGGGNRELSLEAVADHVELSDNHLIVGLHIDWHNHTGVVIPVKGIQVLAYLHGQKAEPLCLFPLERFSRVVAQRVINKTPLEPFALPPNEIHAEDVRFISQEVFDVEPGTYTVDVQIEDTSDVAHINRTKIRVTRQIKYRRTEEWDIDGKVD